MKSGENSGILFWSLGTTQGQGCNSTHWNKKSLVTIFPDFSLLSGWFSLSFYIFIAMNTLCYPSLDIIFMKESILIFLTSILQKFFKLSSVLFTKLCGKIPWYREKKSLCHVATVAKFLDNKPIISLKKCRSHTVSYFIGLVQFQLIWQINVGEIFWGSIRKDRI